MTQPDAGTPPARPIPREEPPPPELGDVLKAIEKVGVAVGIQGNTLATLQATVDGAVAGVHTLQAAVVDVVTRIEKLEKNAPGSNPPPRTASGFTSAVRQISATTESEPDRATAAQVADLRKTVDEIKNEMGLQTQMLSRLVAAGESLIKNPWVRRTAYAAGVVISSAIYHYAATHGVSLK